MEGGTLPVILFSLFFFALVFYCVKIERAGRGPAVAPCQIG